MAKIKRSEVATYINTVPAGTAVYALMGEGIMAADINYGPQTTSEVYIHEDSGTTEVESYQPAMPISASAINGDAVFEFLDALRKSRAVLADAETDIINVWLYETPTTTIYPAEKQTVSVAIETFGGEGGRAAKLNYSIYYLGDAVIGTFNVSTKVFAAT